ncbi:Fc.00g047090.m01.CDS01 [Cosmosporella sp. VM-42]
MTVLDPGILYDWEEKISFGQNNDFRSTAVEIIEIILSSDEAPLISRKALEPAEFRAWIMENKSVVGSANQPDASPACSRLRLVLAGCDQRRDATKVKNVSEFPLLHVFRPWKSPFAREVYELLRLKFRLPRATSVMLSKHSWSYSSSFFQVFPSTPGLIQDETPQGKSPDRIGIVMKFPGSDLVGMDASISLSHSITDRSTDALLLSRYWCQASYISDMIMELAAMAPHPAAIPAMLCGLYQTSLRRQIDATWQNLFDVELASGQSGIHLFEATGVKKPTGSCDDPELSRQAIRATQLAIAWESYVPRGITLLTAVESFLESYVKDHVKQEDEVAGKQSQILQDYLHLQSQRADASNQSAKHLLQRSKIQVEAINNYLAHTSNRINLKLAHSSQKIAMNAKMDSSAMKSIAILTMTFLPATFVAALFATPGVESTVPSQRLYWAVTVPLTAVVLGVWAIWTYAARRKLKVIPELISASPPSSSEAPLHGWRSQVNNVAT